jgi:hypothetical protein
MMHGQKTVKLNILSLKDYNRPAVQSEWIVLEQGKIKYWMKNCTEEDLLEDHYWNGEKRQKKVLIAADHKGMENNSRA